MGWRTEDEVGRDVLQVNLQADKKEFGWAAVQVNCKSNLSLVEVEGWASRLEPGKKQACFWTEDEVGRDALQVSLKANKKEVGRAAVQMNCKFHLSLVGKMMTYLARS